MTNKLKEEEKSQCCGAEIVKDMHLGTVLYSWCYKCREKIPTPEEAGKGEKYREEDHTRPCDMKEFGFCSDFGKYCPNYKDSWQATEREAFMKWDNKSPTYIHSKSETIDYWISRMESIRTEGYTEGRRQAKDEIATLEISNEKLFESYIDPYVNKKMAEEKARLIRVIEEKMILMRDH